MSVIKFSDKMYTKAIYTMYHIGVNKLSFLLKYLFVLPLEDDHMIEVCKETDILHNLYHTTKILGNHNIVLGNY